MIAVTSSHHTAAIARAQRIAITWGIPYVPRGASSIDALCADHAPLIVVGADTVRCVCAPQHSVAWHPSMGLLRAKRLLQGHPDPLLAYADVQPGDRVVDATAGLCTDALVCAFAGASVIAIEASLPIVIVVHEGLSTRSYSLFDQTLQHVRIVHDTHTAWMLRAPARSVDAVLFDPMFHAPIVSAALDALRPVVCPDALSDEAIAHAVRIARKRIVIKQRADSPLLQRVQCMWGAHVHRHRRVAYAVIDCAARV
ncbi:MAG: class I SAM-dependent methyltransferase [Paenibacillaceae bacterium]|nr:class I SAM-dependent methyltransferase [Paenibacillaceae bacterium]